MHCYLPNDCLDSGIVFASWWSNSHQPAQILKFPQYLTQSNFPFSRYPFHCYPSIQLWGPSTKIKMNARRSSALLLIRLSISIKHEAPSPHVGQHHSSDMWQRTSKSTIHIYMSIKQLLIIMQCESTVITYNMSRVRDVWERVICVLQGMNQLVITVLLGPFLLFLLSFACLWRLLLTSHIYSASIIISFLT